jgi:iron complex outermembrane receptor protein
MSLEDLMNIEITSVAKKEQKLFRSASAVYVVTQEEIRRSGVTSIPEVLRLVPGLIVARIDANKWAVSARGFNGGFANKLLVLIDGRSVYTPLFAGVYWDVQDTLLEDVERIEVIRGPGATVWGANAVNGVINIITKRAEETQGALMTMGAGTQERGLGGGRYGGKLGANAHYRIYSKYFSQDEFAPLPGENAADEWDVLRGGFRIDWAISSSNSLTLQGDVYNGDAGARVQTTSLSPPFTPILDKRIKTAGGNILGRWQHTFSNTSELLLQLYYDRSERGHIPTREDRDTFDLDLQHHFAWGKRHDIVWGLGYRATADKLGGSFTVSFDPEHRADNLFSGFVQDEILLAGDQLRLTLGSKLEHNDYTGCELQPSVRLLWTPDTRRTAWAAISRARRTPARSEDDIRINVAAFPGADGPLTLLSLFGNRKLRCEDLIAYELGYRTQPKKNISLDITAFYNFYDHLRSNEPGIPFFESSPLPPHLVLPMVFDDKMHGEAYGVESVAHWTPTKWWKLTASHSWLQVQLHRDPSSPGGTEEGEEGEDPEHQFQLRSYLNLPRNLEFDTALYYVDGLVGLNIPSYTRLDARLGWHPAQNLRLSVGVQNLLDNRHLEFTDISGGFVSTEVKRTLYGRVTLEF